MVKKFLDVIKKVKKKDSNTKSYVHTNEAIKSEIHSLQWAVENEKQFIDNILRAYPTAFLMKHLEKITFAHILDVGSGPVSYLLNFVRQNSNRFKLTSVDALAEHYAELMKQYGYDVPENIACYAEDLDTIFAPKTFDIIFSSNSLDHTIDITKSLQKMAVVLKDDGFIYVLCNINEKDRNKGEGMHFHNVNLIDGRLIIDGDELIDILNLKICDQNIYAQTWTIGGKEYGAPRFEVILRKNL